jgi:nucleotide-binding universal stress UspA family protein
LKPLFEKILVPLDGSEHSIHALEKAVQIAKKFAAKITLIYVYSVSPPVVVSPNAMAGSLPYEMTLPPEVLSKLVEAARGRGANILAHSEKRAKAERVQVETLLKEGHAVEEILKTAKEGEFDLIVIGARGLSTVKEIFLGSVSHGVTVHAPCPVLIVR